MSHNPRKLFGTDGIRGVANIEPVTAETALKIGRAAAHVFAQSRAASQVCWPMPRVNLVSTAMQPP